MNARSKSFRTEGARLMMAVSCALTAAAAIAVPRPITLGQTFPIAEPDTLQEIRLAAGQRDWQAWMRKTPRDYGAFASASLPAATSDDSRIFDPTYSLPFDIKNAEGKVLFARGTKVNVYERMKLKLPGRFIVIGPGEADLRWLESVAKPQASDKILLASGNVLEWRTRNDRAVYRLEPLFIERFGLKAVPAIVTQEGTQLRVTEYALAR